jgi:hypothetical protein
MINQQLRSRKMDNLDRIDWGEFKIISTKVRSGLPRMTFLSTSPLSLRLRVVSLMPLLRRREWQA